MGDKSGIRTVDDLFYYRIKEDSQEVVIEDIDFAYLKKTSSTLKIPGFIEDLPVIKIEDQAFEIVYGFKKVILPDGLREIGRRSFSGAGIREVYLPSTLEKIDEFAFLLCGVKRVTFFGVNKKSHQRAFNRLELSPSAFDGNYIDEILVEEENPFAKDINGKGLYSKDGKRLNLGTVSGKIEDGTEIIGRNAFKGRGLRSVNMPDTVIKVERSAFEHNDIDKINFSQNLEVIEDDSFLDNEIEQVVLPKSLKTIGKEAFFKNRIRDIKFKEGIEEIGWGAFSSNKLKELKLPKTLRTVNELAFSFNQIERVSFANQGTVLGRRAFHKNEFREVCLAHDIVGEKDRFNFSIFEHNPIERVFVKEPLNRPLREYIREAVLEHKAEIFFHEKTKEYRDHYSGLDEKVINSEKVFTLDNDEFKNVKRMSGAF